MARSESTDADFLVRLTRALAAVAPAAYYVGGCVRDCLREEPLKDLDLVLPDDPWEVGRRVANLLGGALFWLREEERVARIVFRRAGGLQVDLSPLRGPIEADLRARDFTVNALAVPVAVGLCPETAVVDPTGGLADLRAGVLRFCGPAAPVADPLRMLRAVRFKHQLSFRLEPETERRVRECAARLANVSRERIRDELFLLLKTATAPAGIEDLVALGLWPAVVPETPEPPHGPEGLLPARFLARYLTAGAAQAVAPELQEPLERYRQTVISEPRTRELLLRWAATEWPLVGDPAGPPDSKRLARIHRSLRLSAREGEFIARALTGAGAALELACRWPVLPRERYRFFRQTGEAGPGAVLLAASVAPDDVWDTLLAEALRRHHQPQAPLLTGREIMQLLQLQPGPWIGRLLEAVEEERADGRIETPAAARAWLLEHGPAIARAAGAPESSTEEPHGR